MTPLGEEEALQRIRSVLGNRIGVSGLEDDAAVLSVPPFSSLVASVDSVVEGVHVDLTVSTPADVGWKALMGALSDLAAMGAAPLGALVALCVPGGAPGEAPAGADDGSFALSVMAGVAEAAGAAACPVLGGDVSASALLTVVVTVLGSVLDGEAPAVARAGARPGDLLMVTGPCGGSAAGLREARAGRGGGDPVGAHRRPVARLREGALARLSGAHAMIDVSDGLALDVHRLADASGVGVVLSDVPVAAGATSDEALGGGEDYELVFAVAPADEPALQARFDSENLRAPLRFGEVVAEPAVRRLGDGELERWGWQHRVG